MNRLKPETAYFVLQGGRALCLSMIFTVNMIYQVTVVGLSPLQLVLVGTTLELTAFLFEVPTGVVADVYSRRLSILIGIALMGLGFIVEGSLPMFAAVLTAQVLWGIGYTFTSGATQAWIVDEIGEAQAGRVFLRGSQIGLIGDFIGIGLGTGLGLLAVNVPVVVGGAALIVLALFLAGVMPETNFKPKATTIRSSGRAMSKTLRNGVRLVRVHPALLTIFGIGLFYGLYSEGYDQLSTAHLLKDMALPSIANWSPVVWFGLMSATGTVISFVATEIMRRKLNTQNIGHLTTTLLGITTVLLGALVGFALTGNFLIAAALSIGIGTLRSLIGPLYDTWINQRLDSQVRATVISMSSQVDAIGQIAGGPGVGYIGSTASIPAALLTSAAILSPVLLLYGRAIRKRDSLHTQHPPVVTEVI